MKAVPLARLEDKIVRPGFERFLRPLLMYRGALTLGRAHRLWNTLIAAMEQEATAADITQRLIHNPDFSHLCGIERPLVSVSLRSFCGRLTDNPSVMAEMPGLDEYLAWLIPSYQRMGSLTPVSEITYRSRHMGAGGWRYLASRPRKPVVYAPRPHEILYPFLIHDGGKPEHTLLRRVTAAVRTHNPELKADLCQDLIVGILAGEFQEDDLSLPAREVARRASRLYPEKYRSFDLDAQIDGDGDTWMSRLADEGRDWA
jgi:hypothetical protein